MFVGHIAKECPTLSSTEIINGTNAKKTKLVKKRKAENESETPPIKKDKVKHSQTIVKQKGYKNDKDKVLNTGKSKTSKGKQKK